MYHVLERGQEVQSDTYSIAFGNMKTRLSMFCVNIRAVTMRGIHMPHDTHILTRVPAEEKGASYALAGMPVCP